jgi:farnesyl-diphosphate farnesyltransferase
MAIDHWQLLRETSRTFALSIEQLPGAVGEAMCLAYLLLRVSDFLEDNDYMLPARKVELLNLWERVLSGEIPAENLEAELRGREGSTDADEEAARHASELLELVRKLPVEIQEHMLVHVRETTLGMARWTERGPDVRVEADMDDYMHEVAGRVGYLSTEIFAWYSRFVRDRMPYLMPLARETGLALQTVNIIRGLRKDYERGWIYVPESFCQAVDIKREDLFKSEFQDRALRVVDMLADKAERHLQDALRYVLALPPWLHHLRLACIWPMFFAVRTLAISRHNVNVLTGDVKITREEVKRIVRDSTLFGWSNAWLKYYFHYLQS